MSENTEKIEVIQEGKCNEVIKFIKNHKETIIAGGLVIGGIALSYKLSKPFLEYYGKSVISWTPSNDPTKVLSLSKVIEILEANKNLNTMYAIFREGPDPDKYIAIALNGSKMIFP